MKKPALKTALMVALVVTLVATGICVAAYHALPQTQTRSQHLSGRWKSSCGLPITGPADPARCG